MNNLSGFRLSDEYFKRLRRLQLTYVLPMIAISLIVGLCVGGRNATTWTPILFAAALLVSVLGFTFWRAYKRQVAQRLSHGQLELKGHSPGP